MARIKELLDRKNEAHEIAKRVFSVITEEIFDVDEVDLEQMEVEVNDLLKRAVTVDEEIDEQFTYYETIVEWVAGYAHITEKQSKEALRHFFCLLQNMTDEEKTYPSTECTFIPGVGVFYPKEVHTKDQTKEWRLAFMDMESFIEGLSMKKDKND